MLAPGTAVRLRVRARDVAIVTGTVPAGTSIRNRLAGRIVGLEADAAGPFAELALDIGGQVLRARLTRLAVDELGLAVGTAVTALTRVAAVERRLVLPDAEG